MVVGLFSYLERRQAGMAVAWRQAGSDGGGLYSHPDLEAGWKHCRGEGKRAGRKQAGQWQAEAGQWQWQGRRGQAGGSGSSSRRQAGLSPPPPHPTSCLVSQRQANTTAAAAPISYIIIIINNTGLINHNNTGLFLEGWNSWMDGLIDRWFGLSLCFLFHYFTIWGKLPTTTTTTTKHSLGQGQ